MPPDNQSEEIRDLKYELMIAKENLEVARRNTEDARNAAMLAAKLAQAMLDEGVSFDRGSYTTAYWRDMYQRRMNSRAIW